MVLRINGEAEERNREYRDSLTAPRRMLSTGRTTAERRSVLWAATTAEAHAYKVGTIFSPFGGVLSILGPSAAVWPWRTNGEVCTAPATGAPQEVFFHPSDETLIAFQGPALEIWRWTEWKKGAKPLWSMKNVSSDRGAALFSEDGRWIAGITGSDRKSVAVAQWQRDQDATVLRLHSDAHKLALANDGRIVVGFRDGIAELWSDGAAGTRAVHKESVVAIAFADDRAVHSVARDGAMTWRAAPIETRCRRLASIHGSNDSSYAAVCANPAASAHGR